MPTYLLTWNPSLFKWEDFQQDWEQVYSGNRPRFEWSCGNTKRIRPGDRVFLMRLGYREKLIGILASGIVTGEPMEDQHWAGQGKAALYVEFEPDVLLDSDFEPLLDPASVSQAFNWRPQSSGITIPSDIAAQLEQAWKLHLQTFASHESSTTRGAHSTSYLEGGKKPVHTYRYERDPRAREECIRSQGTRCVVCRFDFAEAFGDIGAGFIHVHHLTPVAEHDGEYHIDPINDLRPVCPNCHAMLHRRSPPYSIEELQAIRLRVSGSH